MSLGRWTNPVVREMFLKSYPGCVSAFDDFSYTGKSELDREISYNAVVWWTLTTSESERRDPQNYDTINETRMWLLRSYPHFVRNVYLWRESVQPGNVGEDEWMELERALNR